MALDERTSIANLYEREVLPALTPRLDTTFPEFGWQRDAQGWRATNQEFTHATFGVRADRIVCHGDAPRGFLIHGQGATLWTTYLKEHGLTMRGLVVATGLHENALRRTVALLVQRGIVHAQPERRPSRGRPTIRYRHAGDPEEPFEHFLPLLLKLVDQAATPQQDAYDIGRAHGLSTAGESPSTASEAVTRSLASLGFAPLERGSTEAGAVVLALSRCPFSDTVTSSAAGRRVCDLHHGLVAGIAEAHGGEIASFTANDPRAAACEVAVQGGGPLTASGPRLIRTIKRPNDEDTMTQQQTRRNE